MRNPLVHLKIRCFPPLLLLILRILMSFFSFHHPMFLTLSSCHHGEEWRPHEPIFFSSYPSFTLFLSCQHFYCNLNELCASLEIRLPQYLIHASVAFKSSHAFQHIPPLVFDSVLSTAFLNLSTVWLFISESLSSEYVRQICKVSVISRRIDRTEGFVIIMNFDRIMCQSSSDI